MSEPKDRSGDTPGKTFDEAWESLPESPPSADGGTRAWTEEVRGARKHDAPAEEGAEADEAPPRPADATLAWTEEVRGALKKDAPQSSAEPMPKQAEHEEDEMDRLMKAEPADAPPEEDDEVAASASTSTLSFSALELPEKKPDESMMDALMGATSQPAVSAPEEEEEGDDEPPPPPIPLHPKRRPEPEPETKSEPEPEPETKSVEFSPKRQKSRAPLFVGGVVAAGLALWVSRKPRMPPPKDARVLGATADPAEADVAERSELAPSEAAATPKLDVPAPDTSPPERLPPKVDPDRDPREPPEGTPPEIAAVFKKLPVSPADRAPVGGVGKSGIHIDDVSMGRGYERSRCTGGEGSFSVSKDDLANVCLRVVHQRQKEELSVLWQKLEGNARRGKIVVKPAHAYRTRAYLKLRSEYVGEWEVKIFSDDGVELARYPFTIVP
ncbi:MAG: hypothetical protein ACE37F_24805 [Nannocystaceae bacterium]|nr:hypothetical protein [bacterium]